MKRFLLPFAAAAWATPLCAGPAAAAVIISEYVEGSSNNKAVELYNTGASPVDLSSYSLRIYFNGNTVAGATIGLAGSLAAGGTWVIANPSADATVLGAADQPSSLLTFNGNDAIVLVLPDATVVDSIGQVGFDPGLEWGTGLTSTRDNTLRAGFINSLLYANPSGFPTSSKVTTTSTEPCANTRRGPAGTLARVWVVPTGPR